MVSVHILHTMYNVRLTTLFATIISIVPDIRTHAQAPMSEHQTTYTVR